MQTKEEILKQWPNAKWFPGDPAPIGQAVYRVCVDLSIDMRDQGNVVDLITTARFPADHCPTCTCTCANSVFGWWRVAWGRGRWHGSEFHFEENGPDRIITVEYPPRLAPAKDVP